MSGDRAITLPDKSDRRFVFTPLPYSESSSNAAVMRLLGWFRSHTRFTYSTCRLGGNGSLLLMQPPHPSKTHKNQKGRQRLPFA